MSTQNSNIPANPEIEVIKAGKTGLFTNYIFKAIPLVFDESLSYYECLCGLLNYLKNVIITTLNNNAEAVAELQRLYEELKEYVDNYFTNLDVQEEINNKLDAMVEDGTLQEIVDNYVSLNSIIIEDNVSSMLSNNKLVSGNSVKTLGYYSINDGGGGYYLITDENLTSDNTLIYDLTNGLKAKLVINSEINLKQIGAKGDGVTDDSQIFNKIKDIPVTKFFIPSGKYLINSTIDLKEVNGKFIYGCGKEGGHNNEINSSTIIGNTGNDPIFNLIGALCINMAHLNIVSKDDTDNPSTLAIIQGVTQDSQYSQNIEFTKLFIDLVSNLEVNDGYGSIGIYNWQSELNNYTDLFIHSDTPVMLLSDDDVGLGALNGGIRPAHDSLTGNQYTNIELQSRDKYALVLSGSGLSFNGLYLQQSLLILPNQNHDNQNNNLFIQGIIEESETPIILKDGAKIGTSTIQLHTIDAVTLISGTGLIEKSIVNIAGSFITNFSDTNIRFSRCILFRNGKIKNIYSQGNIILNNDNTDPTQNTNICISADGLLWYNGKPLIYVNDKPTRTDLPNGTIALNTGSIYNLLAWKYKENETTWVPMGISRPVESDIGSINNHTPLFIGELLHNVSDNSMYMSYGTNQGNWKKITNDQKDNSYDSSWVQYSQERTLTNFNNLKQYIYGYYYSTNTISNFVFKQIIIKDSLKQYSIIDTEYKAEDQGNSQNETIILYTRNKTYTIERSYTDNSITVTIV